MKKTERDRERGRERQRGGREIYKEEGEGDKEVTTLGSAKIVKNILRINSSIKVYRNIYLSDIT